MPFKNNGKKVKFSHQNNRKKKFFINHYFVSNCAIFGLENQNPKYIQDFIFFLTNNYRAMDIIIPTITGGTYPLLVTITIATIVRWG